MNRFILSFVILTISLVAFSNKSVSPEKIVAQHLITEYQLSAADISSLEITSQHTDKTTGVRYMYLRQTHNGLPIFNAVANYALLGSKVVNSHSGFLKLDKQSIQSGYDVSPETALSRLLARNDVDVLYGPVPPFTQESSVRFTLNDKAIALEQIVLEKGYFLHEGFLHSAWFIDYLGFGHHAYYGIVDANSGEVLQSSNQIIECNFGSHNHNVHTPFVQPTPIVQSTQKINKTQATASYNVFPFPLESPNHGNRAVVSGAEDSTASPFGWHDTNGAEGAEFTITRGNNVYASDDRDNDNQPGLSPDGGPSQTFDADFSLSGSAINYLEASVINLFFWNNLNHDVWYHYGFDEASGNYQENNYGRGGIGGDDVLADAQDGSGLNNANFNPRTDGNNGRMQMFLWGGGSVINNIFEIKEPSLIARPYNAVNSTSGAPLPQDPLTAELEIVDDGSANGSQGCNTITNDISGKFAVVDRGGCNFVTKMRNAQTAGALGVIVVNNRTTAPFSMGGDGTGITIPAIMIGQNDGNNIKARILVDSVVGTLHDSITYTGNFRDSDFDNGVISHEFGHGISTRLTGGANNSTCLQSNVYAEQMGEGWSDFITLVMTHTPGDKPEKPRGIGTYSAGQPITGGGIRPFPYTVDMSVNPVTYDDIKDARFTVPHGVGSVWCTVLWDMYWALVKKHGFDEDIYRGTGGNNMAMWLVLDAMKLQPCGPGFVDGRDAILRADELRYGGDNQKLIWTVFANRGLGYSATQGSSRSRSDGQEAFDLPPFVESFVLTKTSQTQAFTGDTLTYSIELVNKSSGELQALVLKDTLGEEADFLSSDNNCVSNVDGNTMEIEVPNLNPSDTFRCSYDVVVKRDIGGVEYWTDDVETDNGGWVKDVATGALQWRISTTTANSGSRSWFMINLASESDAWIENSFDLTNAQGANLSFFHKFETEASGDGGVVEVFNNGVWEDLGPYFTTNGYNGTISASTTSAIAGRDAFTGTSDDFEQSSIDLSNFVGNVVRVRWRFVTDDGTSGRGWYLDDFMIWENYTALRNTITGSVDGLPDITAEAVTEIMYKELPPIAPEDTMDLKEFTVYPNPAEDFVKIFIPGPDNTSYETTIVNAVGEEVWYQTLSTNTLHTINLGHLASGMYILKVDGAEKEVVKLIRP